MASLSRIRDRVVIPYHYPFTSAEDESEISLSIDELISGSMGYSSGVEYSYFYMYH
jgi:hypothetical protein